MGFSVQLRLAVMMFILFFIWGVWSVTLGTYLSQGLGFDSAKIGRAYSALPWGAVLAPFIVGIIADRFVAAQKLMALVSVLGGVALWHAGMVTDSSILFWLLFAYALCFHSALSLSNAIALNQMDFSEKQFPPIRAFGTAGWILSGMFIGLMRVEHQNIPIKIAACCSVALGVFSLFLPDTPPKPMDGQVTLRDLLGIDMLKLMKKRSFAVLIISSLLICIPIAFYSSFSNMYLNDIGVSHAAAKLTLGQISELVIMMVLPFLLSRMGFKKIFMGGLLAWIVRYLCFAFADAESLAWLYYSGILIHGICFGFLFIVGQIYVDQSVPKNLQVQAQGFLAFLTFGVGGVVGTNLSGLVVNHFSVANLSPGNTFYLIEWRNIWLIPMVIAGAVLLSFVLFFREEKRAEGINHPS